MAGVVTDAATTQPISGALVSLSGYVAFSGADGHYQFAHLPAGSYTAQVKVYGYADSTANIAINDGAAATLDIALTPLPTTTMEGRVKDGSRRQRQPLYARLRFSAAGFTRTVFSDPQTGHYEVNLLQGVAYQITVNAVSGGYQEVTHVFTPTEDRVTYIFFLPEDGTCSALGYQREFVYFEDFEHGAGGYTCLLYTSDAADERSSVDLGGRRIIKKKTTDRRASHAAL